MGHIKYALDHDSEHLNTGKLLYVTMSAYGRDWKSFPHSHYFSELFFVLDGEGSFHVEEDHFPVKKGNLIIVNPHVLHTEVSSPRYPLKYIVLGIEGLSFLFSDKQGSYAIFSDNPANLDLRSLLRQMEKEMQDKKTHYEKVCQSTLDIMLIHLMRSSDQVFSLAPPKNISNECSIAKRYIDSHLQDAITLDLLAEVSHLNKYYLSHKFTEEFGISLINYLLEQRIQNGKQLLLESDLQISMIAQISGFSSQSYFTQTFKKSTGVSPAKYRKLMNASRLNKKEPGEGS